MKGRISDDVVLRPAHRSGDYADERYRNEALRTQAAIRKAAPEKGKKWISQEDHDRVLYAERSGERNRCGVIPKREPMKVLVAAIPLLFFAVLPEQFALGCKCGGTASVCDRFAGADVVFIGKVESKHPDLDPYDLMLAERLQQLFPGRDLDDVVRDDSPETLVTLKRFYSEVLREPERREATNAVTLDQLEAAVDKIFRDGQRITFKVSQAYKGVAKDRQLIEVWTDFLSDCAVAFRKNETYVVYARPGEHGIETGACSGTRRLSEAGEDLVYLHFMQSGDPDVGRIWGFVSGDERVLTVPRFFETIPLPMAYLDVRLRSSGSALQAWTTQEGEFVFDGLPAGDYEIAIEQQVRKVHLEPKACKSEWFYIPKPAK
ncbi:MAG TPA: hypothetical protein VK724_10540 [Bryobacteraceae bacterium]|nr:hypothetical protein [Bryobacteraceae bacterium]